MEKITKGHPLTQSPDFIKNNIETLKSLFPTIVKEGKIDFEELKTLLDEDLETEDEYYRFTWAGKIMARREATKPSTATLRPCIGESKNWDTTENIFIEGDNLEVLKLLQKSYANRIKMIYIDPPYNTGKDFVYKDDYKDNLGNYLTITDQLDAEGRRKSTNTESDGRYHSNWLNMMYPRLKLAKNLLTKDGVIFISADDNEASNLIKVCDEIFGEENFLSQITIITGANQAGEGVNIQKNTEYCLVYSNTPGIECINRVDKVNETLRNLNDAPTPLETREDMGYTIYYNEETQEMIPLMDYDKSKINTNEVDVVYTDNQELIDKGFVPIRPGIRNKKLHRWRWGMDTFIDRKDEIIVIKNGSSYKVVFKQEGLNPPKNYLNFSGGAQEVKTLFNDEPIFEYPKSTKYIQYLISIGSNENDIILDFFAGSGTTADSIFQHNANFFTSKKFICIQLPELTDEKSEAYKAGYNNIALICKERIRRAGEKILNEKRDELSQLKVKVEGKILQDDIQQQINELEKTIETLDVGFKVFKLDSSNIMAWDGDPEKMEQTLFNAASNIKENRTEDDILYEILLKYGLDLAQPIEQRLISDKSVFNIGGGTLFICLADGITISVADGIGKWKEELKPATCKVIFKDTGFTDVEKTNSMQILKRYGIEEVNTI